MSRRRLARPGLSYVDANSGRIITETAELLDMKAKIRSRWPDLDIVFDHEDRVFIVLQMHEGSEKFVLQRTYCDDRILEDIAKADPLHRMFVDPEKAIDDHNSKIEREHDRELEEIAGDAGERLAHAFKKDGLIDHENIFGARRKSQALKDQSVR